MIYSLSTFLLSTLVATTSVTWNWASKSKSTLSPEQTQKWTKNIVQYFETELPGRDFDTAFKEAKASFLEQNYELTVVKLEQIEPKLLERPLSNDGLYQLGLIESLRLNCFVALNRTEELRNSREKIGYLARIHPNLNSLVPKSAADQGLDKFSFKQSLESGYLISIWISNNRKRVQSKSDFLYKVPVREMHRALLATRPRELKNQDVSVFVNQDYFLPSERTAHTSSLPTSRETEPEPKTESIWKSPWLWIAVAAVAGGGAYWIYEANQSGARRTP